MHPSLKPIRQIEELDALLAEGTPVVLFKHSFTCGVSAEALDELIEHLDQDGVTRVRYAIVTVQTDRQISNEVARRFGIRHETPQVLLIRDGRVAWSATHFRVTASAVRAALDLQAVAL